MSHKHTVPSEHQAVTIRRARRDDAAALVVLAVLDDATPIEGDALVAEVNGELWAALALDDSRVISDPFRPAAEARALLALRASLIGRSATGRGRRRLAQPAADARPPGVVALLRRAMSFGRRPGRSSERVAPGGFEDQRRTR